MGGDCRIDVTGLIREARQDDRRSYKIIFNRNQFLLIIHVEIQLSSLCAHCCAL